MSTTVMVVDDSSVQRRHAVNLCRELELEVIATADDGLNALLQLKAPTLKPDLILLDLEMPGVNGIGLLKELGRSRQQAGILVVSSRETVLLSSSVVSLGRSDGLHIVGSVQKPLTADLLRAALSGFSPRTNAALSAVLPADLIAAINAGLIGFAYQPRINLHSRMLQGLRLVPTWDDSVFPGQNRDVLIEQLYALPQFTVLAQNFMTQALNDLASWQRHGLRLAMNIPLPFATFAAYTMAPTFLSEIDALQLPASSVILEVACWVGRDDAASILNTLLQLRIKEVGIALSIDRGQGFTWLEEQGQLPLSEFHLSAGLIERAQHQELSQFLIKYSIQLAHDLSLKTYASNVTTAAQLQRLEDAACDYVSGVMIGELITADEVPNWSKQAALRGKV
ncbi:EAL domain-containing protein [Deefgea sp. CFH1-16]|uniref:EAL domain-containing protein n=1 Tax=Deefgea sp. CFH1-16 TaxID=2675457 RepID=UPI0015F69DD3|nr:EAL domain-containing protein [Deefgea sp. CFH1-16]MBM5573991.1 EAL domain-containing protein [Deefgea sp. CFH1-16]